MIIVINQRPLVSVSRLDCIISCNIRCYLLININYHYCVTIWSISVQQHTTTITITVTTTTYIKVCYYLNLLLINGNQPVTCVQGLLCFAFVEQNRKFRDIKRVQNKIVKNCHNCIELLIFYSNFN